MPHAEAPDRVLITLGGNAILPPGGTGTFEEQCAITRLTMKPVARLIEAGVQVVLTHGNGPIVGNILTRNEAARDQIPPMPLDVCGADSQGGIGYMMQQTLANELHRAGVNRPVVTIVTQVVVDERDPAFRRPEKPIGPWYGEDRARQLAKERGWTVDEDAGRGWRRVVPSPRPLEVVEIEPIRTLLEKGVIVISAGGGGVPVSRERDGSLRGVEAVIDKDLASSLLARVLGCARLLFVTGVERVALHYGLPEQRDLDCVTLAEIERYAAEGHFPPGNMGPKVDAAIEFLRGGGREVIVTSPGRIQDAIEGRGGTRIRRE